MRTNRNWIVLLRDKDAPTGNLTIHMLCLNIMLTNKELQCSTAFFHEDYSDLFFFYSTVTGLVYLKLPQKFNKPSIQDVYKRENFCFKQNRNRNTTIATLHPFKIATLKNNGKTTSVRSSFCSKIKKKIKRLK